MADKEGNATESEPECFLGVPGGWSKNEQSRRAEERLSEYPFDVDSWGVLLREAQSTPIGKARVIYEKLVQYFPTLGKYWKLWAEHELKFKNFDQVEKIFKHCLMSVLSYDLWRFYISYVKETKAAKPEFRAILSQTYEFTLQHVGLDPRSTSIWQEYLHFLKEGEATNSFAEEQKVSAVRKVYQEACSQPLLDVETVWKDYQAFEQGVNKVLASKLIEERKPVFLLAKKCSVDYEELARSLTRTEVALPPKGTAVELRQKKKWQQYIDWEKSNPMHYSDSIRVAKRVTFAYKQCLLQFVHHADVWYAAAHYLEGVGRQLTEKQPVDAEVLVKEVREMYKQALSVHLPKSTFLHFAYADFEESQGQKEKAQEVYEGLLQLEGIDPTLVYIQYLRFARRTGGVKAARNVFRKAREDTKTGYQVFVAAAMMEYYSSKDPNIAFKVFELGLKRYGENIDYILSYIDYISHQNEENNTRALFHRVLATLPPEQSGEILTRFAQFETNTGDLASIQKVEADREKALKESYHTSEGALLVDRYKYLDLYPCSELELLAMEHPDVTTKVSKVGIRGAMFEEDSHLVEVVRPDLTQMMPFKPSAICGVGLNAVPGGFFPAPEAVASLMQRLPPPECFKGPFVDVGKLMDTVVRNVPEHPHSTSTLELRGKIKENEERAGRKRPAGESSDTIPMETHNGTVPPALDLFRARQQKRANLGSN